MLGSEVSINLTSPVLTAHLRHVLGLELLAVVLIALVLSALRPASTRLALDEPAPEPSALRLLRLGTAVLWLAAGASALRSGTALGLGDRALPEATAGSPAPLSTAAHALADRWLAHPTWAAAASAAVALGLGLWMLAASPGRPLRLAAVASGAVAMAWWTATGIGGLLGHGGWATGAGGAAPWLVLAALALSQPAGRWRQGPTLLHLRRGLAAALGLLGLAQALGLRSAWAGGAASPVASLAARSANASPWAWLANLLRSSSSSAAHHAVAWNAAVVVLLLAVAVALWVGGPRLRQLAAGAYALAALAAWLLVGGTGLLLPGAIGLGALPSSALVVVVLALAPGAELRPAALPSFVARVAASLGVAGLISGSVLAIAVAVWPGADRDLAMAGGLSAAPLNGQRPPPLAMSRLNGSAFSLGELRGKVAAVIFMDPICDTDCSALARELDAAVAQVGSGVVPVVVNLNPAHASPKAMARFAAREGLTQPPWVLLTGSPAQIRASAAAWQVSWAQPRGGGMLLHDDPIYVLGPGGRIATAWEAPPDESGGVAARSAVAAIARAIEQARGR